MTETNVVQALIAPKMRVATTATMPGATIHNLPLPVDAEIVCDAMIAADVYGRAFIEAAGAEEQGAP